MLWRPADVDNLADGFAEGVGRGGGLRCSKRGGLPQQFDAEEGSAVGRQECVRVLGGAVDRVGRGKSAVVLERHPGGVEASAAESAIEVSCLIPGFWRWASCRPGRSPPPGSASRHRRTSSQENVVWLPRVSYWSM